MSYFPNGAVPKYLTPSNPANLTSTSYSMFGLGSSMCLTPLKSGKVQLAICFFPSGVGSSTNNFRLCYGSGTAPLNGAAAAGTVVGGTYVGGSVVAASSTPAAIYRTIIVTGLTVGVSYWFDLQAARNSGNTSVGAGSIEATLQELL
ncbi:MAG TPA: hypothetical protein VMS77_04240 [Conexivisphaerales archaeon]|nr:hypothetical protein [Conexivisphaerales archaeon]